MEIPVELPRALHKRVSHTAADDEGIYLIDEVIDNANLIGDLSAAENGNKRTLRIGKCAAP